MAKEKNIGIRIDDELRLKLKYVADYDDRSMNNLVVRLIQSYIQNFEKKHGPIDLGEEK